MIDYKAKYKLEKKSNIDSDVKGMKDTEMPKVISFLLDEIDLLEKRVVKLENLKNITI